MAFNATGPTPQDPAAGLRPYQQDVVERVTVAIRAGNHRVLLVAPTGAGKTIIAAKIATAASADSKRVLFIVHRRELVQQASHKLHDVGLDHGIIAAGFPARPGEPAQVASVQTLHARAVRSRAMDLPPANILIVDEAHHATARTWRRLLDSYPDAVIIGLTATPCRGDGRGLGGMFEALIECPSIAELIEGGYLVPTKVYAPTAPDLAGIRVERGGNYASVKVGFYGYDTAGNRGVGCGLNGVWITRRGEPLGAASEPWAETEAEDFSAVVVQAQAAGATGRRRVLTARGEYPGGIEPPGTYLPGRAR